MGIALHCGHSNSVAVGRVFSELLRIGYQEAQILLAGRQSAGGSGRVFYPPQARVMNCGFLVKFAQWSTPISPDKGILEQKSAVIIPALHVAHVQQLRSFRLEEITGPHELVLGL